MYICAGWFSRETALRPKETGTSHTALCSIPPFRRPCIYQHNSILFSSPPSDLNFTPRHVPFSSCVPQPDKQQPLPSRITRPSLPMFPLLNAPSDSSIPPPYPQTLAGLSETCSPTSARSIQTTPHKGSGFSVGATTRPLRLARREAGRVALGS